MFIESPATPVASLPEAFYVPRTYFSDMEQLRQQVAAGKLPTMANGYHFISAEQSQCDSQGLIPPSAYTQFFSRRQIPLARPDTVFFPHDISHIPSYQNMFRVPCFADVVQKAAGNSLHSSTGCEAFTLAMDDFGDALRSLSMGMYDGMFEKADIALGAIINLCPQTSRVGTTDELHTDLWHRLAINHYQE